MAITTNINIEIHSNRIIQGILEDFSTGDIIDFVEELVNNVCDDDVTNGLYEVLRKKHNEWLSENNISEKEYQEDYADFSLYPDEEVSNESWMVDSMDSEDDDNIDEDLFSEMD